MTSTYKRQPYSLLALAMGLVAVAACLPAVAAEFEEEETVPTTTADRFWRLDIGHADPASITLRDYDGVEKEFWYVPLVIGNFTDDDRRISLTSVVGTDVGEPVYSLVHPALFRFLSEDTSIVSLLSKLREKMVADKKEELATDVGLLADSARQMRAAAEKTINPFRRQYFLEQAERMTARKELAERLLGVIDENLASDLAVDDSVSLLDATVGSGKIRTAIIIFPNIDPRARVVRMLFLGTTNAYATIGRSPEEKFLNGVYQIYYRWPGDPYNRQRDPFVLEREGYIWIR